MTSKSKLYLTAAIAGALSIAATATAQTAAPTTTPSGKATPTTAAPTTAPTTAAPTTGAPATDAPAAAENPMVGGVAMDATKSIAVNASAAPNLSTLVTAVKAAGLVTTLSGPGPFTVFAPTNDAFTRLAPGTVETLLKPANKATLAKVLTYHVVPGTLTFADLQAKAKTSGGKVVLTTVEGEPLTLDVTETTVQLTDVNGNKSFIETPDVKQSNGVVHVVNGVLLPKL